MCRCSNKDDSIIKKVKQIIRRIAAGILLFYISLVILVNIPAVQSRFGIWIAGALSEKIGTEVSVGKVNIGMLNRLIIDDISILDQAGNQLIKADRTAVNINLLKLFNGTVSIGCAQSFGLSAYLYKDNPDATPNYQFLLDSLKSDSKEPSRLDFDITTLIIRRGHVSYDILSEPQDSGVFTPHHLNLDEIDATVSLHQMTDSSLTANIKRFNLTEKNSGFRLKNLQTRIHAEDGRAHLTGFNLKTPQSSLYMDTISVKYVNYEKDGSFLFRTRVEDSFVTPSDFASFVPALKNITSPLYLSFMADGSQNTINLRQLNLHTDNNSTDIRLDAKISDITGNLTINADNIRLFVNEEDRKNILNTISPSLHSDILDNIGDISYTGNIVASSQQFQADGRLTTDVGNMDLDAYMTDDRHMFGNISTEGIDLAMLTGEGQFGKAVFDCTSELYLKEGRLPDGTVNLNLAKVEFNGREYSDISADINSRNGILEGTLSSRNPALRLNMDAAYNVNSSDIDLTMHIDSANVNVSNRNIGLHDTDLSIDGNLYGYKTINLSSDGVAAMIQGEIGLDRITDAFENQLAAHLPTLIKSKPTGNNDNYTFDIELSKSSLTDRFIPEDIVLNQPVYINGMVDDRTDTICINVDARNVANNNRVLTDAHAFINGNRKLLSAAISGDVSNTDDEVPAKTAINITADAHDDRLTTLLKWNDEGMIYATSQFTDSLNRTHTHIDLHSSQFTISDTIWSVHPARIDCYGGKVIVHNMKIANDGPQEKHSLTLDGIISDSPADSLVATLKDIDVDYITGIANFTAVDFSGLISGSATLSAVTSDKPQLKANIVVDDMHLQRGRLGTGYIQAFWDKEKNGVDLLGHIVDTEGGKTRTTDVSGYVAPSTSQMDLQVDTHNTNAEFLNGFLSSTFKDISGDCNGTLHIIGPLNDVNLVGDISADVSMRLRATETRYHINPQDSIHLRLHQFSFDNIRLTDDRGVGCATVNGTLSHRNMKNFAYDFNIGFDNTMVYDEKEFNSDKFLATVFVDGSLDLHGSDGHPLRMNADITPCKGSVFAYDAATPDAISSSNFVEIREKPTLTHFNDGTSTHPFSPEDSKPATNTPEPKKDYTGDIFFDININVTPDCEIKLRMDNLEDGYMTTVGNGTILAHYHNKSPFTMNGEYQIESGKYRLYLQDIIYRDLEIQPTSNVVFNGNPFDASIHLLCHHTINAVPLRDLTGDDAFNQNSKVKVICVLDITGNLGSMNFGFDLQMPNVSEETRQLVKSLISSEEEMNMQMIYLLGLGRFYTNEYTRATGESNTTTGAVNTLLSSTISGQVNQMLSNLLNGNSNWNFGTGLSTGENGWNDLDVEGILSGKLLNDRLLINGNFGYRDNTLTNQATFIGDFDVRWRLSENGNTYIKAYNQTNDRYFTKATLNTQGIGITYQRDYDTWRDLFRKKAREILK